MLSLILHWLTYFDLSCVLTFGVDPMNGPICLANETWETYEAFLWKQCKCEVKSSLQNTTQIRHIPHGAHSDHNWHLITKQVTHHVNYGFSQTKNNDSANCPWHGLSIAIVNSIVSNCNGSGTEGIVDELTNNWNLTEHNWRVNDRPNSVTC